MRILISAPRKSGNAQLRCMLGMAYHLRPADLKTPPGDTAELAAWLANLPGSSTLSTDIACTAVLKGAAESQDVQMVAIIRHPFDLFVSTYDVAQQRAARERADGEETPWAVMAHREISDPVVLSYAAEGFQHEVDWLSSWQESGCPLVKYERLEADPVAVLGEIASRLTRLSPAEVDHAISLCPAENAVASRPGRGRRMPPLHAGAWRERLPDNLRSILRERYALQTQRLGYDLV